MKSSSSTTTRASVRWSGKECSAIYSGRCASGRTSHLHCRYCNLEMEMSMCVVRVHFLQEAGLGNLFACLHLLASMCV
ncbi:hypothetical protein EJ03DRAFT_219147 [Teratosphaeria nubilosa]|uniref:Uncharacterized protein n=1 Tax=Teratosphaeria nubilosa TaxID=161662 RepID=A0A6G1KXN7_9PEZI|nr:hypothetical protein EJ03DRAFT_219147 [Teratosphaeria nubilosa]